MKKLKYCPILAQQCKHYKCANQTSRFFGEIQMKVILYLSILLPIFLIQVQASCKTTQPMPTAFANPGRGNCPIGYYSSGGACVPSSRGATYAFFNNGGNCPNGYYSSGKSCVASSASSCNAFYNNAGSCPIGYYSSGNSCVSN